MELWDIAWNRTYYRMTGRGCSAAVAARLASKVKVRVMQLCMKGKMNEK